MSVIASIKEFGPGAKFNIYSDSTYVIKGATQWLRGWKRNNWMTHMGAFVKNADLWKELDEHLNKNKFKFIKVKAHSGVPDNEEADRIARNAAKNPTEIDVEYAIG